MARDTIVRDGAELVVETGTGLVTKLEQKQGARNAHVTFKATHTDLRDPVSGWLDTFDTHATELVSAAFEQRFEIEYRIEVHRKENVDKTIPISDVAKRDKVRDLVRVASISAGAAPQGAPAPSASGAGAGEAPTGARRDSSEPDASRQTSEATRRRGPKVAEARPWEELNSDGSPNLGCYAVQAAAGMVDLAVEVVLAAERDPFPSLIRFVAARMLEAADEIQAGVRPDGRHDRMDNSHSRARGILRTVLRVAPFPLHVVLDERDDKGLPIVADVDAVHGWHRRTVHAGVALLQMALELSGVDWRGP